MANNGVNIARIAFDASDRVSQRFVKADRFLLKNISPSMLTGTALL
jgi:hypothetical protein